ncbi:MAG: insulinase family protein, partial [Nanoarchaeota archaeon]
SSVLFQEIREKRGLAYAIRGNMSIGKNFGHSTIYTATLKEKIRKCEEIILKEIKSLKNINKKDFEETKEQLIGLNKVVRESSDAVMSQLIFEEITENAEEYYKYEERINSVKLEEIRKIAKLKTYSTFSLIPES